LYEFFNVGSRLFESNSNFVAYELSMIEGEEIFESAQETGYRLCRAREGGDHDTEHVFSAQWDLNDPDRFLVCLQNGQLRVFNMKDNTRDKFGIIFRRYTPVFENDITGEKQITFHWDKMTTIPGRPDEIIFLLGVSRTLMYTAIPPPEDKPYPDEPLLASTARSDFPGFIFGSPVMEVASHAARITSMSVSPAGHILATGDELGNVRLLLLRLLEDISVFNRNSQRKKKHSSATTFSEFLPAYNILHEAHPGPVFSIEWLPILCAPESTTMRHYALATGSIDRSVRIWRVSCSSSRGIRIAPAMILDTLSTHILSLNSYLHTDRFFVSRVHRLEELTRINLDHSSSNADRAQGSSLLVESEEDRNLRLQRKLDGAKSIFIAAGTNVGTIYVWKVDYVDVFDSIADAVVEGEEDDDDPEGKYERPAMKQFLIDDGTRLYSLLQTSARPIIHLSLISTNSSNSSVYRRGKQNTSKASLAALSDTDTGDIVLAASDTQGAVRIYTPEKLVEKDPLAAVAAASGNNSVVTGMSGYSATATAGVRGRGRGGGAGGGGTNEGHREDDILTLHHHPLHAEYRSKMSQIDAVHVNQRPLVRVGEQNYGTAVVTCRFPPAYPPAQSDKNDEDPLLAAAAAESPSMPTSPTRKTTKLWDPTEMQQRCGPLIVGLASGEILVYRTDDLSALTHSRLNTLSSGGTLTGGGDDSRSLGGLSAASLSVYSSPVPIPNPADHSSSSDEDDDSLTHEVDRAAAYMQRSTARSVNSGGDSLSTGTGISRLTTSMKSGRAKTKTKKHKHEHENAVAAVSSPAASKRVSYQDLHHIKTILEEDNSNADRAADYTQPRKSSPSSKSQDFGKDRRGGAVQEPAAAAEKKEEQEEEEESEYPVPRLSAPPIPAPAPASPLESPTRTAATATVASGASDSNNNWSRLQLDSPPKVVNTATTAGGGGGGGGDAGFMSPLTIASPQPKTMSATKQQQQQQQYQGRSTPTATATATATAGHENNNFNSRGSASKLSPTMSTGGNRVGSAGGEGVKIPTTGACIPSSTNNTRSSSGYGRPPAAAAGATVQSMNTAAQAPKLSTHRVTESLPSSRRSKLKSAHVTRAVQAPKQVQVQGHASHGATVGDVLHTNEYAFPTQTMSKVLEANLHEVTEQLENDEISVSTQRTTQSDQMLALRAAEQQAITASGRRYQYDKLTSMQYLDHADLDVLVAQTKPLKPKAKVSKQVDPKWLANRKNGGPSAEATSQLSIPDPVVTVGLNVRTMSASLADLHIKRTGGPTAAAAGAVGGGTESSSSSSAFAKDSLVPGANAAATSRSSGGGTAAAARRTHSSSSSSSRALREEYVYNQEFGLRHSTDPRTQLPIYRTSINMDQLFGRFDPLGSLQRSEPMRESLERDHLLSLVSSSADLYT